MPYGTHVRIIGNVASPGSELKAQIKRELIKMLADKPFRPLVIHYGARQRAHAVARDYAHAIGGWQVHTHDNVSIAQACQILFVIDPGTENDPASRSSEVWSIAKKACPSGRMITHMPVAAEPQKRVSKPSAPATLPSPVKVQKNSLAWALRAGRAGRLANQVAKRYSSFRQKYGLPDSPKAHQQWAEYKKAAEVPSQPREAKKTFAPVPVSRSRASVMGAVPLTPYHTALLRKTNLPDLDVWR